MTALLNTPKAFHARNILRIDHGARLGHLAGSVAKHRFQESTNQDVLDRHSESGAGSRGATLQGGFSQLTVKVFWPPFIGGLIWAVSSFCAFTATHYLGMARANGIWSPLNITVSLIWGAVLSNEFPNATIATWLLLIGSAVIIISARPQYIRNLVDG